MDYCLQGWLWVILGTVSIGIGGLLATYGWDVWSKQPKKTKWSRKGIGDVIIGSIVVALGGLLVTNGWNDISLAEQKRNLIRAVVDEWVVNSADLNKVFSGPVYYCEEGQKRGIQMFPTLSTSALNAVLASGLFEQRKSKFFMMVLNYKRALVSANKNFDIFNNDIVKMGSYTLDRKITQAEKFQNMTRKSPWGKNLYEQHYQEMGGLLKAKYMRFLEKQWDIKLKDKVQSQEKSPTIKPQEATSKTETPPS